jgi:hypothetical protein
MCVDLLDEGRRAVVRALQLEARRRLSSVEHCGRGLHSRERSETMREHRHQQPQAQANAQNTYSVPTRWRQHDCER